MSNLVPSTTPQQSSRGFVAPSSMPIKKTPDITEIIGEGRKEKEEDNMVRNDEKTFLLLSEEKVADGDLPPSDGRGDKDFSSSSAAVVPPSECTSDFPTHWRTLFNHVFSSVPTIYIPLKETLPEIENNIIKVIVKNDVQKEHFEAKIREVLEYLRTHFDEKLEDVVVESNELLETKKVIYDVKEKLQNFKEQNPEIEDFMKILELKIKD